MHGRQTTVRSDGSIEFRAHDRGVIASMTFEKLYELASKDVQFAVAVDQALMYAFMTTADEHGFF